MTISSTSSDSMQRPDFAQMRAAMFKKADTDGNGTISKDELATMLENAPARPDGTKPSADELFSKIDTDGNGQITQAEDQAFAEKTHGHHGSHHHRAEGADAGGFSGSADLIKKLLDLLGNSSSSGSSTDNSSTTSDGTDSGNADASTSSTGTDKSVEQLLSDWLAQLQQKNATYSADGSTQTTDSTALFTEKV